MRARPTFALTALIAALSASAQHTPLRTQPVEKLAVSLKFRDWGPATVTASHVFAGNVNGSGGLYAIDANTGRVRWSFFPKFSFTYNVNTPPAVAGKVVVAPFAAGAVVAFDIASGKELWRGPKPALTAAVGTDGMTVFFGGEDGDIYALDAATGQQRWKVEFEPTLAPCYSKPLVTDNTVILTAIGPAAPKDPTKRGGYYIFAFDKATGQERWRFRGEAPYIHNGVCLSQPARHGNTLYSSGESRIYAVDLESGRSRWPAVELRRTNAGRVEELKVSQVVAAPNGLVLAVTPVSLLAVDGSTGKTAWEIPGTFQHDRASLAVVDDVLYFQGSPQTKPAARPTGTLHALDLNTHEILWSYTRETAEPWSFGPITPATNGIWVDTYKTLLRLQ